MSSGASPAAGAASSTREPLAVRLIGRGSAVGALVVLGITALYAVVLPMTAARVTAPEPPRILALGEGASVEVDESWAEADPGGVAAVTLAHGGATLVLRAPVPSSGLAPVTLERLVSAWAAQAPDGSVTTAPRAFDTSAGDSAATAVLQEPLQTIQAWVVTDGAWEVTAILTAPATSWEGASSSAQGVVLSMRLPEAAP